MEYKFKLEDFVVKNNQQQAVLLKAFFNQNEEDTAMDDYLVIGGLAQVGLKKAFTDLCTSNIPADVKAEEIIRTFRMLQKNSIKF